MKTTKICPKCSSSDIVRYSGNNKSNQTASSSCIALGDPVWELIKINRYICCQCGYTEEWIDKKDLKKIIQCKEARESAL